MSLGGKLTVYHSEQPLDAIFIKCALDDFSKKTHDKPLVIVLDNGPIHHAKLVKDELENRTADAVANYADVYFLFTNLQSSFKSH